MRNNEFLHRRGITPMIHIRRLPNNALFDGIYTVEGAPTCMGGKPMEYVRTDPRTGHHLYRCPAGGCDRKSKIKGIQHLRRLALGGSGAERPAVRRRYTPRQPRVEEQVQEAVEHREGVQPLEDARPPEGPLLPRPREDPPTHSAADAGSPSDDPDEAEGRDGDDRGVTTDFKPPPLSPTHGPLFVH